MSIYTKKGDAGETGLPGKRRLSKTEALFELLGNLDSTNAGLGVALAALQIAPLSAAAHKTVEEWLVEIQRDLLSIGACVAAEQPAEAKILTQLPERVAAMEAQIDQWDGVLPELKNFILPGGSSAGAAIHQARTIARQTERAFHRTSQAATLQPVAVYLNRLSDFLFQTARFVNWETRHTEEIWLLPS
jgi:cob(I)alamin adenosyltransferase